MNNPLPLLLLCCLFIAACGTSKKAVETGKLKKASPQSVFDQLVRNQVQFDWLDARANIDIDSKYLSAGGTLRLKIRRDSIIWMSVKKFGFEAARAQVTPDSVYILDRLNNEYAIEPLSYLEQRYQLPARFDLLQQLLLGNPIFFTTVFELDTQEQHYILNGRSSNWSTAYFVHPQSYRLDRMKLEQPVKRQRLDVSLDDYQQPTSGNRDFSYLRKLLIDSEETGEAQIEIAFTKVEFDAPTDIRFEIPTRYERNQD